ncbi:MAG: hypothetical protein HY432_02650 [Candidatus Liptonbacteria bacterium]|nr:hypothetical protein [Candidatus Liptonbacteria bacterium]
MALPEQLVDRLSEKRVQTSGWSGRLMMFSGTVFFLSVAVYVGLIYGYEPYLESRVADLDKQIQTFAQQVPPEDQQKLISFYSQIANLQNILSEHIISSQVFDWLEKNTEASVYYSKFVLLSLTNEISLRGFSRTADDFAAQLSVFQNDPLIEKVAINSFTISSGNLWEFDVTLTLREGTLNKIVSQQ